MTNSDPTLFLWRVVSSNGRFWQMHDVVAASDAEARAIAESDAGANSPHTLRSEASDAACTGVDPAGRYAACHVAIRVDADPSAHDPIAFIDAGGEG